MRISYVVTSYNNGRHIHDCVNSILSQTRPVAEIIIADDASTDGSQELIVALAQSHPIITPIFREKNLGVGANRHLAFCAAKGDFITNLAGDDSIASKKIENEAALIEAGDCEIAYSDFTMIFPETGEFRYESSDFAGLSTKGEKLAYLLTQESPNLPHHMLYSKELYLKSGGYDPNAPLYEDWSLKLRLAKLTNSWAHTGEIGLRYNKHGEGLSSSALMLHVFWRLYVIASNLHWLEKQVSAHDLRNAIGNIFRLLKDNIGDESKAVIRKTAEDGGKLFLDEQQSTLPESALSALETIQRLAGRVGLNESNGVAAVRKFVADCDPNSGLFRMLRWRLAVLTMSSP